MKTAKSTILVLLLALADQVVAATTTSATLDPYANETKDQHSARMAWWREARFGMFIHWGVYAVPAGSYKGKPVSGLGEWIMKDGQIPAAEYKAFATKFTASKYDPEAWARLAKKAGMRYIVITSKHHDGFALFDSKSSDWDSVDASGAKRDLIAPLAKATRSAGLKFGLYYSQAQDWTHPGGAKAGYDEGASWDEATKGNFDQYLRKIAEPQVKEILTQYQPDILWWDTPSWMNKERADLLIPHLALVPGIIHNNRLGGDYMGDTETPEQHIPATGFKDHDWEVCMTMNDTWGFKSDDHNWRSVGTLIHQLCDIASKGGNFLLNVGPNAEGEIPQPSIERLEAVGRWMDVNGEAIYGTSASPFHILPWGRCTKKTSAKGTTLYLHVFDWPANGKLRVPGLKTPVDSATQLAGGQKLAVTSDTDGATLTVPNAAPDAISSVIKLDISGDLDVDPISLTQDESGKLVLEPIFSEVNNSGYGRQIMTEAINGYPSLGNWTDHRAWVQWTFTVKKPGTFRVTAEMAGIGKSKFHWGVDNKMSPLEVEADGGYQNFKPVEFGTVKIDQAGTHTFAIKPVETGWQAVNLRSVTLKP